MKPATSSRQMSEHFTKLWNKIVCRRSIYDVLMQNEKWTCIENRAYQDTEFTSEDPVEDIENLLHDWITETLGFVDKCLPSCFTTSWSKGKGGSRTSSCNNGVVSIIELRRESGMKTYGTPRPISETSEG